MSDLISDDGLTEVTGRGLLEKIDRLVNAIHELAKAFAVSEVKREARDIANDKMFVAIEKQMAGTEDRIDIIENEIADLDLFKRHVEDKTVHLTPDESADMRVASKTKQTRDVYNLTAGVDNRKALLIAAGAIFTSPILAAIVSAVGRHSGWW